MEQSAKCDSIRNLEILEMSFGIPCDVDKISDYAPCHRNGAVADHHGRSRKQKTRLLTHLPVRCNLTRTVSLAVALCNPLQ
jgi:hypothetical protein